MNKHIAFLLGSGFSVPAGLPTANIMNNIIKSTIYDRIRLSFKDGCNNVLQSFILEKLLTECDEYEDFNYERYFDFIKEEKDKELDKNKLLAFIERGMYGYWWKCSMYEDTGKKKHRNQVVKMLESTIGKCKNYQEVVEGIEQWYQHIIARNIIGNTKYGKLERFSPCYQGFIDVLSCIVKSGYIVDIYTLNHDLYLESLLSHTDLKDKVSNGFGGDIDHIKSVGYKTFNTNFFNNTIRIYKLHGSIDVHELSFTNYRKNQYIQMMDGFRMENPFLLDGEKNGSVLPLFLTGKTSKGKKYEKEPYKSMIAEFKDNVGKAEKLIVIGYSGNDEGINEFLYDQYSNWKKTYVISPNANEHPFVKDKGAKPLNIVVELLSITDLDL